MRLCRVKHTANQRSLELLDDFGIVKSRHLNGMGESRFRPSLGATILPKKAIARDVEGERSRMRCC
ncbi:unnamed protein product [Arabis nemorensis]|uniref:Uncharacterized protein n=1 Tax=Arabis nemorensis TaxID=586526 RepID=A0A565AZX0_9BRAS|nr:unnamed protein product [Arabis nemorensis]